MRKRGRESIVQETLSELAEQIVWVILMLFGYLGYYAGVRPYFLAQDGGYTTGFLDGIVVAASLLAFSVYLASGALHKTIRRERGKHKLSRL
jgi:hypothetical protein